MTYSKKYGQHVTELRQSNASGKHGDRRLKRLRTRGAQERKSISDNRREE